MPSHVQTADLILFSWAKHVDITFNNGW